MRKKNTHTQTGAKKNSKNGIVQVYSRRRKEEEEKNGVEEEEESEHCCYSVPTAASASSSIICLCEGRETQLGQSGSERRENLYGLVSGIGTMQ